MKKSIVLLSLLLCSSLVFSQALSGPQGYGKVEKRYKALNFLGLPVTDTICDLVENTSNGTCEGAVVWRTLDLSLYVKGPDKWYKIATGGDLADYYTKTESDARYPLLSGNYANPSWITSLAWSKITGTPTTLSGYGITDAVSNTRSINTTSPLLGGGNLTADRTLSIQDAVADGTTKGAATYNASDFNSSGGVISIDYTNGPPASGESGVYRSGTNLRLGTNQLLENANIPLNGFYFSLTGNGTPLGTGANPAYDFRHENDQAGIVGVYTKNTNSAGAAIVSMIGSGVGVSGGIGFYNPSFVPAFENSYTAPGVLQVASGSQANGVAIRSINPAGEIRLMNDTMNVLVIDSSRVVPGRKAVQIYPKSWPENFLEIVNNGNTIIPDSPLHAIPTGLIRNNWALLMTHGVTLDNTTGRWLDWDLTRPMSIVEAGYEGAFLHAAAPGRHFSDQLHECVSARGKGIDFANGGSEWDTGKVLQAKVPLVFKHDTRTIGVAGDGASWEKDDPRPFIVCMAEETKAPAGEFMRFEQNAPTTSGGQFYFRKSRGSNASKTAGSSGDMAGIINWSNYDGAGYVTGARIMSVLEATATAGNSPTALRFDAGSSSGTLAERMRITSGGNLLINTTTNNGTRLQVNGGISTAVVTVTGNTTLDATAQTYLVNNSGSVTITLPAASGISGRIYTIKKISAASNDVVIDPNASELLDGSSTSKTLTLQWSSITIQSNGTSWFVLSSHAAATTL